MSEMPANKYAFYEGVDETYVVGEEVIALNFSNPTKPVVGVYEGITDKGFLVTTKCSYFGYDEYDTEVFDFITKIIDKTIY